MTVIFSNDLYSKKIESIKSALELVTLKIMQTNVVSIFLQC